MAYTVYDDLRNAVVAELDNTAFTSDNSFGDGTQNQVDRWLEESERAAYREEITRNPAFLFRSTQTLYGNPDTDMNQSSNTFFYPENFLEFDRVIAQVDNDKLPMIKVSPDIIESISTDTTVRIPGNFAELNRTLITIPVANNVTVRMYYYGSLDPIRTITSPTRVVDGNTVANSHYLLNELGEWLLYDACLRGGTYFGIEDQYMNRWIQLRDEVAMGVYRQARRAKSSGSTPRRTVPSQYHIRSRQRRGYY